MFTLSLLRDAGYRPLNCLCLLAWLALHWYARAGPICMQGHVNLMGYGEFDNDNRPAGWNGWPTFVLSPARLPPSPRRRRC
jgi:hypothetical protein